MSNSSRLRALNQVDAHIRGQIFPKTGPQSMRNTSDTHATRTDLEFRNRRRSLDRLEGRHASRGLRSNFRFGIFGSIRNPFPRSRRATPGTARVRVFRSFSPFARLVQSPSFARAPLASNFTARAREWQRHARARGSGRRRRGAKRREEDRLPNGY